MAILALQKTPQIRKEQKFVSRRLQHLSDTATQVQGTLCASRVPGICERALQLNGVNDQQNRGRWGFSRSLPHSKDV